MNALAALALGTLSLFPPEGQPQANVVLIVADQLAYWATDPAQRAPLDLPSLDTLAASGVTFTRCYATSPVCSANRLALLSGQYPFQLGTNKLNAGVPHLGSTLTAAGYDTGYIGKWHLSPSGGATSGYVAPADRQGWNYFAGNEGAGHNYNNGVSFRRNDPTPISTAPWEPTWDTSEAVRFMRAARSKPFALVVNYGPPHGGGTPNMFPVYSGNQITPRPNVQPQDVLKAKSAIATYMNLTVTTDAEVGVLLAEIDLATTFVVFTSDHGQMLYSQGTLGNQHKRRPWEESSHVPLIIAGPGIARGVASARLISTLDIFPSILALLAVPTPGELQGAPFPEHEPVYLGLDAQGNSWLGERWRALVGDNFKYAVSEGGTELLHNLVADPFELTNLVGDPAHLPTLQALRRGIRTQAGNIGDPFFR